MLYDRLHLTVYDRQRNEHLRCVVSRHDDRVAVGNRVGELANGDGVVADAEQERTSAAALLGPARELAYTSTCSPRHHEDEYHVEGHQQVEDTCNG